MTETIIYGGSFNPPTNAHGAVLSACAKYRPQAEVWVMPSGSRYDKQLTLPVHHRLGLLAAFLSSQDDVAYSVEPHELYAAETTRTWRTVERLATEYPDRSFTYLFGADSYHSMPHWNQGERLQKELPMIVVPRHGSKPVAATSNVVVMPVEAPKLSSTLVRESIAAGKPIDAFVCNGVQQYIRQNDLYTPAAIGV